MAFKIYTPPRNPKEVLIMISVIAFGGIVGSILWSTYFAVVALLFWIQYTFVLSYKQFKKGRKYEITSITKFLLNPQARFFIFVFIATIGILSVFYITPWIAYISLAVWWLFSYNFYRHYTQFRKVQK